jgi:hypothetical protein
VSYARTVACGALAAALLLAGCRDRSRGFVLVKNVCVSGFECLERDAGVDAASAQCDEASLQCVYEQVVTPYRVVLQVRPKAEELELVEQFTYPAFNLNGPLTDHTLQVPLAEQVNGKVSWTVDNETRMLESEVTFVPIPRELGAPVTSTVVKTRGGATAEQDNLQARLSPDTDYQVRVQPLLDESAVLPPLSIRLDEPSGDLDLDLDRYSSMERRTGQLVDEYGAPFAEHRVRLEDKMTGEVLSSTGKTGNDGSFELFALPTVMSGEGFNVVVSLQAFPRWRVKLAIDGAKLVDGAALVLPRAPESVEFSGVVRAGGPNAEGPPTPHADIIFVSKFPLPDELGRGADWCRWQRITNDRNSPPLCSASIATTADSEGKFSVQLLPGRYEVFGVPSGQPRAGSAPLRTTRNEAKVLIQDDGKPHSGQTVYLARAPQFEGKVLSYREEPMPNVTVTARAVAPQGQTPEPGRQVYQYARSAVAVTDDEGRFHLDIDLGYFDLSAEPTAESGFAWVQLLNREIDEPTDPVSVEDPVVLQPLVARPPVIVAGRVMYEETPLSEASVEAFALIDSITGGRRAVRIAQTTTDQGGFYHLNLPPEVRDKDPPQAQEEGDAGASTPSSALPSR